MCYSTETKERVSLADKALVDSAKRGDMKRFVDAHLKGGNILQTDGDGMSVLHNAARFNYKDIVQYILVNGPPGIVDMLDKEKWDITTITLFYSPLFFFPASLCE